jgi:transcriptional regulator with XRE-family HTH domain
LSISKLARSPALESLRVHVIVGRARAQLSQDDLAQHAGVSRPTISRIERGVGDASIDVVQRIADALNVTVAELFTPLRTDKISDDEIQRRIASSKDDYVDADALLNALEETGDASATQRYSRAGRPAVAR